MQKVKSRRDVYIVKSRDNQISFISTCNRIVFFQGEVVNMCLVDTTSDEDIHINDALCEEGFADFVPDSPAVSLSPVRVTSQEVSNPSNKWFRKRAQTINRQPIERSRWQFMIFQREYLLSTAAVEIMLQHVIKSYGVT